MASGLAIASGVMSIGGAIKGSRDMKKGASRQRDIDLQNIERQKKEGAEQIRRTGNEQRRTESEGLVAAGGGGITGGSKAGYLEGVAKVHKTELDWLKDSVESGIDIAGQEAQSRYRSGRDNATASLITGIGLGGASIAAGYGTFVDQGKKWWG